MELEQYRAIRRGAGLLSRTSRGLIAVRGNDRSDYLQGLLTNDIAAVSVGAGCYAAYLTPQGRLELDLEVFNLGDWILLDVDAGVKQTLITRLENLVFTEDVSVVDMSERWISYGLHGPATLDVVEAAFSSLGASSGTLSAVRRLGEHQCCRPLDGPETPIIARTDELGVCGVSIHITQGELTPIYEALMAAGSIAIDQTTADLVRIESGRPAFPVDMGSDTIPLEAGIEDRAISFTKGCYVGQEVIVRILHRGDGRVARRLVGLTVQNSGLGTVKPEPGAMLWSDEDPVGTITSAALSPALGCAVALGYLPRALTEIGTRVRVDLAGERTWSVVTATPFVSDLIVSQCLE